MEKEILRLINSHNGKLSWYQLDRALSYQQKYVDSIHRLVDIVKDLEHKGLMRSEGEGPQPRYWITDAGRKLIAEQEAPPSPLLSLSPTPLKHLKPFAEPGNLPSLPARYSLAASTHVLSTTLARLRSGRIDRYFSRDDTQQKSAHFVGDEVIPICFITKQPRFHPSLPATHSVPTGATLQRDLTTFRLCTARVRSASPPDPSATGDADTGS